MEIHVQQIFENWSLQYFLHFIITKQLFWFENQGEQALLYPLSKIDLISRNEYLIEKLF